jgi:Domain of unknown function (DUF5063)
MQTDFEWGSFRGLVKRVDDLLGGQREDSEFAEDLRRATTFVYTAGLTMPSAGDIYEEVGGEAFADREISLDLDGENPEQAEATVLALLERIARSVEAVQPEGDIDGAELLELAESVALNLLHVKKALAEGSAHFDAGRLGEASWEWAFQFDEWGGHALAALSALHELLWGAR